MLQRLKDSSIPGEMKSSVAIDLYYDWDPADTEIIYTCLWTAISKYLFIMKKPENGKVALKFSDYKGNMLMAAIVTYHEPEDESMAGNWTLEYSLDPEDLKGINPILESNSNAFHKYFSDVALKLYHYKFLNAAFQEDIAQIAIRLLIECLDRNATAEEEYAIELPNVFVAKVRVEDGKKYFGIEASSKMSQLIKGDEEIEV